MELSSKVLDTLFYGFIGLIGVMLIFRTFLLYWAGKKKEIKIVSKNIKTYKGKLTCPICGKHRFYETKTMLNTFGLTIVNYEWLNKNATNYICVNCGHILWYSL